MSLHSNSSSISLNSLDWGKIRHFKVQLIRGQACESEHQVLGVFQPLHEAWQFSTLGPEVFPRSSIKMVQALPLVETGAFESLGLKAEHLVLACASHRGESQHLGVLRSWLGYLGLSAEDLACGPHRPLSPTACDELVREGLSPQSLHNNCSGKHLGFLSVCKYLGYKTEAYHDLDHPIQKLWMEALSEVIFDETGVPWLPKAYGIDGCGIPTFATPLGLLPAVLRFLARPNLKPKRETSRQKILEALWAWPQGLTGSNELLGHLMELCRGQILVKSGAEGVLCGVFKKASLPGGGFAFALKSRDGSSRALQSILFALLDSCAMVSHSELRDLKWKFQEVPLNTRGEPIGELLVFAENP